jgi:glycosyltransferase involved in cell wall biosynthesis
VLKYPDPQAPACRRIEVVPNGVALRALPPECDTPRFLVHGRLAPSKRIETIFEAFACLCNRQPHAELHVFGNAEPRHTEYAAQVVATAPGGVIFRGPDFSTGYLAEPWTAAVVLGTHQGCPNAVLEASSAGVPVIANASGGTGELVVDGETGWLLGEQCDVASLAHAMIEVCASPCQARLRGLAGRTLVRERHRIEMMATRYLAILSDELVR